MTAMAVPEAPPRRAVRSLRWLLLIGGAAAASASLAATNVDGVERFGLFDVLEPAYFAGVGAVAVGFFVGLEDRRRPSVASLGCLAALIVLLHGLPGLLEPHPRFGPAWLHVGFIDHLAGGGGLLLQLDARFSWSGFFAGGGLLQRAAATEDLLWLLRFTSVAVNALACWAIYLLGRPLGLSVRQRLAAMPIFVVANWAGQDYFSPQATAFSLYLVVLTIVVTFFGDHVLDPRSRVSRLLRPAAVEALPTSARPRVAIYLACVLGAAAMVMSHQLTPFFLASALLLLSLSGVIRTRALAWIVAIGAIAWLAFAAEAYWAGHFGRLAGSVGKVGDLAAENVGNRAAGAGAARRLVLGSRIGIALVCWLGAAGTLLLAYRRRRTPLVLACLLVAPFPMVLLQPYGGEMIIRVFFFTLPAVALLLAMVIVPSHRASSLWRRVVAGFVCAAVVPAFVLARFGNESYEQVTDDDREVLAAMYDRVPDGSLVFVVNRFTVLYAERVGEVRFRELQAREAEAIVAEIDEDPRASSRRYVLLTRSQEAYGEQVSRRPARWVDALVSELKATGRFRTVERVGPSWLLQLVPR